MVQVPYEALKTVLHDLARPGRPPDPLWPGGAVISQAKKRIKPTDMIHVKVREKHMINCLNFGDRQVSQTALATVKKQPGDFLTTVNPDKHRIITARFTSYLKVERLDILPITFR